MPPEPTFPLLIDLAGSRPGGRGTFLLRGKKVPKETRPAAPALRASLATDYRAGRPLNSLRSDKAAGPPRPDSPPLGRAEGTKRRFATLKRQSDLPDLRLQCSVNGHWSWSDGGRVPAIKSHSLVGEIGEMNVSSNPDSRRSQKLS